MNVTKPIFALLFCSHILSACIAVPRFVDEPYSDLAYLKTGSTTKNDVIDQMGEPGATYLQETEFVYTKFRPTSSVALMAPGGIGYSDGDQYFLQLIFDAQGVLSDFQLESGFRQPSGCIASGWCAGYGKYGNQVWRIADRKQEIIAKQFSVAGDRCGIYFAGPTPATTEVSIDGRRMGAILGKPFFQYWNVEPGNHDIAIELQPGAKESWSLRTLPSLQLDCMGGDLIFIQLKAGWSTFSLDLLDRSEGREQIGERRLIVPGPMRGISEDQLN